MCDSEGLASRELPSQKLEIHLSFCTNNNDTLVCAAFCVPIVSAADVGLDDADACLCCSDALDEAAEHRKQG